MRPTAPAWDDNTTPRRRKAQTVTKATAPPTEPTPPVPTIKYPTLAAVMVKLAEADAGDGVQPIIRTGQTLGVCTRATLETAYLLEGSIETIKRLTEERRIKRATLFATASRDIKTAAGTIPKLITGTNEKAREAEFEELWVGEPTNVQLDEDLAAAEVSGAQYRLRLEALREAARNYRAILMMLGALTGAGLMEPETEETHPNA